MALTKVSRGLLSTGIVDNSNATAITIDSSENVSIGTVTSPTAPLNVQSDSAARGIQVNGRTSDGIGEIGFKATDGTTSQMTIGSRSTYNAIRYYSEFRFQNSVGTNVATIDSSGNLLVGHSGTADSVVDSGGQGVSVRPTDVLIGSTGACLYLNREDSNGILAAFRKDGANVGSIGVASSNNMYFCSTAASHSGILFGTNIIYAADNTGAATDNITDLGHPSYRFDDIYATNGTIQTSDRNEKQDIEALSDAEQRVAVACKGLLRKFRWIDAVEAKGDDARIHFGIIAQDLQAAFEAEGLDAARYAMFISNTWWETQTEVAAVEAVEATEDTEAIEAVDAYTRTDTYDTAEEAPEGATERTRLGVRYSELLAFIIAAI